MHLKNLINTCHFYIKKVQTTDVKSQRDYHFCNFGLSSLKEMGIGTSEDVNTS